MNISQLYRKIIVLCAIQALFILPAFSLDLDSTVIDNNRSTYEKQTKNSSSSDNSVPTETKEKNTKTDIIEKSTLPAVPALPKNVNSSTVSPLNTQYSGKVPNEEALTPYNVTVKELTIDDSVVKSKTVEKHADKNTVLVKNETKKTDKVNKTSNNDKLNYRTCTLAKGTQIRAVNKVKITDSLKKNQTIEFLTTQELITPCFKIPKNTKLIAKVEDVHKPQMSCNGSLVALRIVSANINGYNQTLNAGIIKIKTDNIHFSNLKGEHTYLKTVCKKAKWGQNMYSKWSKTSSKLADKGAAVILAPFPYIGGCVLAVSSTISSPVTALLGKGGYLSIPANTVFTIKLYEDAKLRY